jgi:hypothetical protein
MILTHVARYRPGTPSTEKIIAYWLKAWPSFVDDPDEPACFACHIITDDEGWPRLQRCHIVAHSIGGAALESNFVILCEDCHRAAPMTDDRSILLAWVHERPSWSTLFANMALDGLRLAGLGETTKTIDSASFNEFLRAKKLDFHPHSTRFDRITCIAYLLREYLDTIQ